MSPSAEKQSSNAEASSHFYHAAYSEPTGVTAARAALPLVVQPAFLHCVAQRRRRKVNLRLRVKTVRITALCPQ